MAFLKKAASAAEPFHVPTLAEACEVYAALETKVADLQRQDSEAAKAVREAEAEIAANPAPAVRASVAELLGDGVPTTTSARQRLADANRKRADIAAALEILRQRIRDAKGPAARKAAALVRPEFDRRSKALCDALLAADAAHQEIERFFNDLEAADIEVSLLGERPFFLGNPREADRHIVRYVRQAEARHG